MKNLKKLAGAISDFHGASASGAGVGWREALFFARFLRPYLTLCALGLLLAVCATGFGALLPLSGKALIDFVVMKEGFEKVEGLLAFVGLGSAAPSVKVFLSSPGNVVLVVLLVGAAAGALGIVQRYVLLRLQYGVMFDVQTALFGHILRFPISFFRGRSTGYIMSRVQDDVSYFQAVLSQGMLQAASKLFYLVLGLAIAFALDVKLALMLASLLPVYGAINYYFGGRLRATGMLERERTARVSEGIQEVISGVETVKAYGREEREGARVSESLRAAVGLRMKGMALYFLSNYAVSGFQFLAVLVVMWAGTRDVAAGRMTIGDFVAFTTYALALSGAVKSLSMFYVMLQPGLASMARLKELFLLVPEAAGGARPASVTGDVSFKGVSFSYGSYGEGRPALDGLTFDVRPGEVVALVGPSGAGKTTAINLLLRFYSPQAGAIYLDGRDIAGLDPEWLRAQIAVVSQDVFLFNDTVEANIRYGCIGATAEKVAWAAERAGIHGDITALPDGYQTVVGERGVRLSVGQRQRVAIARAFLRGPRMLVFDEPASALDTASEAMLKASLKELSRDRTTFIISHRMSLVDIADRVIVIKDGRAAEQGAPGELAREGVLYRGLLKARPQVEREGEM